MLAWGNFITIAINFLIIAWVLFLVVQGHQPPDDEGSRKPAETRRAAAPGSAAARKSATCWRRSRPDFTKLIGRLHVF